MGEVDLGAEDEHCGARLSSGEEGLGQLADPEQSHNPPRASSEGLVHEQGDPDPGEAHVQYTDSGAALAEVSNKSRGSRSGR